MRGQSSGLSDSCVLIYIRVLDATLPVQHTHHTSSDDSFCVKDDSSNMLFERLTSSGLGLTIGSIGGSTVRNITFRFLHHTTS